MLIARGAGKIIDLSHKLGPGMPAYPGLPAPQFRVFLAHEDASQPARYAPGTTFQIASYELGGNTGTYVDAPFHRHPQGPDPSALSLEKLANLPGIVISAPADGPIEPAIVSDIAVRGKAVLIPTDWRDAGVVLTISAPGVSSRPLRVSTWCMPARRWSESSARTSTT